MAKTTSNYWVARWATATVLVLGGAVATSGPANAAPNEGDSAPVGLTLPKNRQTISSALRVDLTRD
nr:hypothetical protein [Propionibacteriaceae bacterium]